MFLVVFCSHKQKPMIFAIHRDIQQMEDNQSQSYDESKLQSLRREVQVSKSQLLQLAYNDQKLLQKLEQLNSKGCQRIGQALFYEAMVFLAQAQNVLQYAAGCGRTIDRTLIIATLHNQACVYQRIWELTRSADYIQAIVYNISSFLSNQSQFPFTPEVGNKNSIQHHKLTTYLGNKLQLISYNLQFCAVSSQIKNHQNALNSAQKSLNLLKSYCEQLYAYQKFVGCNGSNDFQRNLLLDLQNIRNFQNQSMCETQKNIQKLLYKAKKSIVVFQKKIQFMPLGMAKQNFKQLQNFSLGQLMQVSPILLVKMQQKLDLQLQLTFLRKIYKAIYISIAHFTMATQLRLLANQKHGIDSTFRKLSKQFKQSEVHHLVAIITVALYVPCYTKYFQHILNSFKNHYQIDLTQMSDLSLSDDGFNKVDDDLIHLEIQSVSQRDSDINNNHRSNQVSKDMGSKLDYTTSRADNTSRGDTASKADTTRQTDKMGISFQKDKPLNRTNQQVNVFHSSSSSQNQNLKKLNRTARDSASKELKKKEKSKKKLNEQTSREKKGLIQKLISRSKSGGKKQNETKRSKSRKSMHEQNQQKERVVHYFQYDNYSKKVVKKKLKTAKQPGDYELTKKILAKPPLRDKKSPQALINNHLKKLNLISQSTKDLINGEVTAKMFKKCKSPDLNTSRSQQKLGLKKHI